MHTIGFIRNGFWSSPSLHQMIRMFEAAAKPLDLSIEHHTNTEFLNEAAVAALPEHTIFWDKDVRLATLLELHDKRLYNRESAISLCDDKTLTYLHLKGVPMPKTLLCPYTFPNIGFTDYSFLKEAADSLGLPFILKQGCGSFGQQVFLISALQDAMNILPTLTGPILLQKFIKESAGEDVRVYIAGGRTLGAIRRKNTHGDFRANITIGGTASPHTLSEEETAVAVSAAKQLGLDFAGVDLLLSNDGPLLCEVNSNAHFVGFSEATGVSPAIAILESIREQL